MKKIKMIWDFHGPDAQKIAEHHEIHLKDYLNVHPELMQETGIDKISINHYSTYMIQQEKEANELRAILKPHRGQYA